MYFISLKTLYFFLVVTLATVMLNFCQIYSIDIVRYEVSYSNAFAAYEPGWNLLGQLANMLTFDQFMFFLYTFQAWLIALIYKRSASVTFLPLVLLIIAPALYTNQLRWGVASLLVIVLAQRGYRFWAIVGGINFHIYAILFTPITYFLRWLDHPVVVMILVLLSSFLAFLLIDLLDVVMGVSYFTNADTSVPRSLIGGLFSFLIMIGYFSLPADRRRVEVKLLYICHLMSASFVWFAIVSGRLSDAAVVLEPFLAYELLVSKSYFSKLIFCFLIISWMLRIYQRWAL